MAREWEVRDFDPKTDPMKDCSEVEGDFEGYDPQNDPDNEEAR